MELLFFFLVFVVVCFCLVVVIGAPYLPAHNKAIDDVLSLIKLSKGGRILDLGCGDGKFLIAAAKKGYKVTGYEINIILFLVCKLRLLRYKNAEVKLKNFWRVDFPEGTEVVYVFLLDKFMGRLDEKMKVEAKRLRSQRNGSFDKLRMTKSELSLVSYTFKISGKKVEREVRGVRLYRY